MDTAEKLNALRHICTAIIDTVKEGGAMGVPGGHIYAALMSQGATLDQYNQLMAGLVRGGYLTRRGECYYPAAGSATRSKAR